MPWLKIIQIIISLLLIISILLQNRGTGLGSAFGGDSSVTFHTRRGFERVLFIATFVLGALFVISADISHAVARAGFQTDQFVRMIERRLSGDAHMNIGPGVMVSSPECGCTIKYLGTKIEGHVYAVYLDKMD